jgi:hypothetical protein
MKKSNLKTYKRYEDKLKVNKFNELKKLEAKNESGLRKKAFENFEATTLKMCDIVGEACEWFLNDGRQQLQEDGITMLAFDKITTDKNRKEDEKVVRHYMEVEAKKAKKQDFVKRFFDYSKSNAFVYCKVFSISPVVRRKFKTECLKKGNKFKIQPQGLIDFANGLNDGKTAEQMQSEASDKKEAKKEAKKAPYVHRDAEHDAQATITAKGTFKSPNIDNYIKSLEFRLKEAKAIKAGKSTHDFVDAETMLQNESAILEGLAEL